MNFDAHSIIKELDDLVKVDGRVVFERVRDHIEGLTLVTCNVHEALLSLLRNDPQSMLLVNAALQQYQMFFEFSNRSAT